jgi:hypothetical protein
MTFLMHGASHKLFPVSALKEIRAPPPRDQTTARLADGPRRRRGRADPRVVVIGRYRAPVDRNPAMM